MGHSLLKHVGQCGGNLHVDISRMFSIRTPSVNITSQGIFVGVVELQMVKGKNATYELTCEKCAENISKENFNEDAGVTCMVCRKTKPSDEVSCCEQIAAICTECAGFLSDRNTQPIPDYIRPLSAVVRITRDMKLKTYSEILKQNIQL